MLIYMKNNKNKIEFEKACPPKRRGFTLIELLIVIAIIGILASIVTISSQSAITKAKRTSALTTAASLLPEIVTCQDDSGRISAYSAGGVICIEAATTNTLAGHSAVWINTTATTGWTTVNAAISASPIPGTFYFTVTKPSGSTYADIKCKLDTNGCCDVGSTGC